VRSEVSDTRGGTKRKGAGVKEDKMCRVCSTNAYRLPVGNPEGRRPLERPRRAEADNIKMDIEETGHVRSPQHGAP
jgi:hypothetical protein